MAKYGSPSLPPEEAARLAALERYAVLDTPAEDGFDGLAGLAAQICAAPVGLITFVDGKRQFFKARIGFDGDATASLDVGFCPLVVRGAGPLIIPDARADPAYAGNAAVTEAGVRFYAGVPLRTPDGHALGTICVLDHAARPEGISDQQRRALETLAAQTVAQLELRRAEALARHEGERAWRHGRRLALLAEASARLLTADGPAAMVRDAYALLSGPFRLDVCFHYRCEAGWLGLVAAAGLSAEQEGKAARLEFGQTVCGTVAATRQAANLAGIQASNNPQTAFLKALGIDTYASVPLLAGDEFLGTLSFGRQSGAFSSSEFEVLLTLASNVAMALKRFRAEAALRESEARLQAIFDTIPVGVIIGEAPSGRVLTGNRQAEAIFGHSIIHSPDVESYGERVSYHSDGRRVEGHEYPLARVLAGAEQAEMEVLYQRGDGRQAWVRCIAAPIRADGRLVGGVVAIVDIDRETRALQALARTRENLEARVREEVQAREAAQARLAHAQRMEALGQLAGGIAHDFNNVLQAVQGGAAMIERRPADAEGVRRLARMIFEAARRGASVTRRLLSFSRRGDLRAEPVAAASLLADMREILAHTLGAGMKIQVKTDPSLPPLLADKAQLETVLVNLATNARDATRSTGTLTLAAAPEMLQHDGGPGYPISLKAGAYVRLSVADTGAGMDAATLSRASEPFFTTKRTGEGTGLGLAMARGFAEQSGGGLHIESELGRGTVVKLWLPVAEGPPLAAWPSSVADIASGEARGRLLLVDDDASVLETLAQEMEAAGYAVLPATSGTSALSLLNAGEIVDLVVSDLSMPGMDGLTLVREAQRRRPGLPAVLLTGFATDAAEIAVGGAVSGTFALLRKPIEGRLLAERVAVLLEAVRGTPGPC